jgi:hypothetical protein
MSNTPSTQGLPGAWVLVAVGSLLFAALFTGFVLERNAKNDRNNEAAEHLAIAAQIESAEADGAQAAALLQEYVTTGDETLLPEMQTLTDSGVQKLTEAISRAGEDPGNFVASGAQLVQAGGQIIALRQTGDVQGAVAALTELSGQFTTLVEAQNAFVADQRAQAVDAQDSADSAETLGTIFLAAAIAVGAGVVAGASLAIRRRFSARRVGMASG